jgi:hypothetical protein
MIIVSEPSAKATQPVRTGRYTPARHHSSAARKKTPRYTDARPISVHTGVLTNPRVGSLSLRRALLRDCPRDAHEVVGHLKRGYPVVSAPRRSPLWVGVHLVQRVGVLQLDPYPRLASRQARRRDGILASVPLPCSG